MLFKATAHCNQAMPPAMFQICARFPVFAAVCGEFAIVLCPICHPDFQLISMFWCARAAFQKAKCMSGCFWRSQGSSSGKLLVWHASYAVARLSLSSPFQRKSDTTTKQARILVTNEYPGYCYYEYCWNIAITINYYIIYVCIFL